MSKKAIDAIIMPSARTAGKRYFPSHFAENIADIMRVHTVVIRDKSAAQARNQGLRIARSCEWEHIMFLDDDIKLHVEQIADQGRTLRSVQVVAFTAADFPDNSVVRHAARAAGMETPVYPGSGAMMVNLKKIPETRRFPEIYNEDWFFMHGLDMVNGGDVEQLPYNPFTPGRAAHQELGDLIAEAIQGKPVTYDKDFWENAIRERRVLLDSIQASGDIDASLIREASKRLDSIDVKTIQSMLRHWQEKCV